MQLAGCAPDSESTAVEPSSVVTSEIVAEPPSPTPLIVVPPEDPLARELLRATSLAEAVDLLQSHFGDESNQTAFTMRRVQAPRGADLLEDWMTRATIRDADLWDAPRFRAAASLSTQARGTRGCVHVARFTRADPAEPFSLLATAVGEPESTAADFYLRVVGSLPARLPAHFCGVYTGLLTSNDGSAPKIVGRFVGPRPGVTQHHP